MSFFCYIDYFFFIAKNWNVRLAFFSISQEVKGEKKYKINTLKIDNLKHQKVENLNLSHASIYQGSNYYLIEKAFEYLKNENANKSLVDFGSGKGRILVVAAYYGFKNITGIDFVESLCKEAERNIEKKKALFPATNFKIICGDAANYTIENDANVFFFFNPFDEVIMLPVVKNILLSFRNNPRKIYVVYLNPLYKEIFLSAGFKEEYFVRKMEFLEFSILSKSPEQF